MGEILPGAILSVVPVGGLLLSLKRLENESLRAPPLASGLAALFPARDSADRGAAGWTDGAGSVALPSGPAFWGLRPKVVENRSERELPDDPFDNLSAIDGAEFCAGAFCGLGAITVVRDSGAARVVLEGAAAGVSVR